MADLRFKTVFRRDGIQGHFRLFRVMWETGKVGEPGGGHSNMVSVAIQPRIFAFERDGDWHWMIVLLGIRVHRKVSFGGIFV